MPHFPRFIPGDVSSRSSAKDPEAPSRSGEGEVNDADARLWHPCIRINWILRAMLTERWSAETWPQVRTSSSERSRCGARSGARDGLT